MTESFMHEGISYAVERKTRANGQVAITFRRIAAATHAPPSPIMLSFEYYEVLQAYERFQQREKRRQQWRVSQKLRWKRTKERLSLATK